MEGRVVLWVPESRRPETVKTRQTPVLKAPCPQMRIYSERKIMKYHFKISPFTHNHKIIVCDASLLQHNLT